MDANSSWFVYKTYLTNVMKSLNWLFPALEKTALWRDQLTSFPSK